MNLDPSQVILQLGIAGLMLFLGWKIAVLLIEKLSTAEAARTKSIAEGFAAIAASIAELTKGIAEIRGRLDEARWYREEFTPIGPIPRPSQGRVSTANGLRPPRPGTHHDEG